MTPGRWSSERSHPAKVYAEKLYRDFRTVDGIVTPLLAGPAELEEGTGRQHHRGRGDRIQSDDRAG
jgi:hypothetical protein